MRIPRRSTQPARTARPEDEKLPFGQLLAYGSQHILTMYGGVRCRAFAQNVGLVALTTVKSRYVVAMGGAILLALGLLPVVGRAVAAAPDQRGRGPRPERA
jgi:xanthine/uracil permease